MHWYFAIDEAGGLGGAGALAKLAVLTARAAGGLRPHLLYYGNPNGFTAWMEANGVTVIETAPSFIAEIEAAEAAGAYKAHSIGHWLRVAVPLVERAEELVLYTDCDVIFLRPFDLGRMRPRMLAAAPEFRKDNWNYFNAGVMLMNIPAMRASYAAFARHIVARIAGGHAYHYDDEVALNEVYRGRWDRLDPRLNWKPYWGSSRDATILHFHGPKPDDIAAIAAGRWRRDNPTGLTLGRLLDGHLDAYIAWCTTLGDQLQMADLPTALRFHEIASALTRYRATSRPSPGDLSFMDLRLFPEDR